MDDEKDHEVSIIIMVIHIFIYIYIMLFYVDSRLVLRILPPDDSKSSCPLGLKYGSPLKDVPKLLETARDLDLNVIGVR